MSQSRLYIVKLHKGVQHSSMMDTKKVIATNYGEAIMKAIECGFAKSEVEIFSIRDDEEVVL